MKWPLVLLILIPFSVEAKNVSPSLKASVMTAKEMAPEMYAAIRDNLSAIELACREAPAKIKKMKSVATQISSKKEFTKQKLIIQHMPLNISKALENEIKRIDKSFNVEGLCLEVLFQGNLLGFAEKEALAYLRDVQKDVESSNYKSCSTKLQKLLQAGGK